MDRSRRLGCVWKTSQHGASIVEAVIALPVLLAVILGSIQFALVYEAKATLNHASLQAARLGAVRHAEPAAMRRGLARGLVPLYSPESSLTGVVRSIARIDAALASDARIRILNPTREAFTDFGVDIDGEREIPNDRLHARSTATGAQSGINIQDANLLKVQVTYGYELHVPLVNWFIARVLLGVRRGADPFEQQLLRRMRIPIIATATVRMQSPARLSDAVVSLGDFPSLDRIPANAAPPPTEDEEPEDEAEPNQPEGEGPSSDAQDAGSGLDDGFFGFGSGSTGGGGGGDGGDGGEGDEDSGGVNGGNPQSCGSDDDNQTIAALAVGNPIHVVTGNKYQLETDLEALPGTLGLAILRHYNSFAGGWRWNYDVTLRARADGGVDIVQSDGRLIRFESSRGSATYLAQRAGDGSVVAVEEGYEWRWASGRRWIFDQHGRLMRVREEGAELVLTYNERNELTTVVDPQKRALRIDYYANGRIASIRGPAGSGVRYLYDDVGNLSQSVATDGASRRYLYEDARHPHHLTGVEVGTVRPLAYGPPASFERLASWRYDEAGRAVSSSHPQDAGRVTLVYGDGFTDVADAFGRTTRYITSERSGIAFVSEVRGPGCGTCGQGDTQYAYDERFRVVRIATKHAGSLEYRYDDNGRLAELTRSIDDKSESIARYVYEGASARPSRVERPSIKPDARAALVFGYTGTGLLASMREEGYAPDGAGYREIRRETRLYYDDASRLIRIDGPRDGVDDFTGIEYDTLGRVAHIKSSSGEKRILQYDAAGRPTRIAQTGRPDLVLDYDVHGRVTAVTQQRVRGPRTLRYRYDIAGRLMETIDADGRSRRYGLDGAGRPMLLTTGGADIAVGVHYSPDDKIERAGAVDANGRLLRTLYFTYDAERRLTEVRDGDGQPLQRFAYERDGALPVRFTDPLGHETRFSYDAFGRIESMLAPDGGTTRVERDAQGRLTQLQAPNGANTHFVHDDFGRRVEERSADRGVTRYRYDAAGNLIEKVDARGMQVRLDYDAANRLVRVERAEGISTLTYANGVLTAIDSGQGSERFEYDADAQVVMHARRIGDHEFKTRFSYDPAGRVETKTLPSGARLRYRHNAAGELQSITQERVFGDRPIVRANAEEGRLDALGHVVSGNDIATRTSFDARSGNIARRVIDSVTALQFDHDEAGRIRRQRRDSVERRFDYDAVGRLTSALSPLRRVAFDYDLNGNRMASKASLQSPAVSTIDTYSYESRSNRLSRIAGSAAADYRYDAAGNPLSVGSRRYEYDSSGRATRFFDRERLTAEYRYNFWGERVRKDVHGAASTLFIYEQQKLIAEADATGEIVREYVYVDHHPVAMLERGELFWIHTDHLAAPIAVTNAARKTIWRAEYEPFGAALVNADPDRDGRSFELNLRLPGQYADAESGTSYNYFRDYDPNTGRYLSPDPLGTFAGPNVFTYAHNDPLRRFDSLGLYDEMIHYYMTYFLGLVAGLPQDVARTMAIASQFIDENYLTRPLHLGLPNYPALPLYHFVLDYGGAMYGDSNDNRYLRFQSPQSDQLNNLLASTDPTRLRDLWIQTHPTGVPGLCPVPSFVDINNARYQLFGEYLHAFQDTFAHRDAYNMPYAIEENEENTPVAWVGHGGPGVPDWFGHAPDHTYNQNYRSPSRCTVGADRTESLLRGLSREECSARNGRNYVPADDTDPTQCEVKYVLGGTEVVANVTEAECAALGRASTALGSTFHPGSGQVWAMNELRTLRMEYEVFNRIRSTFAAEIAENREAGGQAFGWSDIAGTAEWDRSNPLRNSRIGNEQSFEEWASSRNYSSSGIDWLHNPEVVLQQFNASRAEPGDRLEILNAWLRFQDLPTIEEWPILDQEARGRRSDNIGWIPSGSFVGTLVPRDSPCLARGCGR